MDCNHDWQISQTDTFNNGGYMVMKFCRNCKTVEGSGFINSDHELHYLESMLEA